MTKSPWKIAVFPITSLKVPTGLMHLSSLVVLEEESLYFLGDFCSGGLLFR